MKKDHKTISTALVCAALAFAAAAAVFYYRAVMSCFDVSIRHFEPSASVTAFIICAAVFTALSIASGAVLYRKSTASRQVGNSTLIDIAFVILGALILSRALTALPDAFRSISSASQSSDGVGKNEIIALVTPLFGVFASAYFITAPGRKKLEKVRSYLSFTAIIWALFETLSVYFDSSRTINSPIKAILLCLSIVNMIFITEDVRFLFGTQKAPSYRAISAICVCFGVAFALPDLLCAVFCSFGKTNSSVFASPDGIYGALSFDWLTSLIALIIPVCAGIRIFTSNSYLTDRGAPKHEKQPSTPFGEAPVEKTDDTPGDNNENG